MRAERKTRGIAKYLTHLQPREEYSRGKYAVRGPGSRSKASGVDSRRGACATGAVRREGNGNIAMKKAGKPHGYWPARRFTCAKSLD